MSQKGGYGWNKQHSHLEEPHTGKKKKKGRTGLIVLFIVLLVLAAVLLVVGARFYKYYKLSNYVSDEQVIRDLVLEASRQGDGGASAGAALVGEVTAEASEDGTAAGEGAKDGGILEAAQAVVDGLNAKRSDIPKKSGIYNLLLVGVDRRDDSWSGNSDSIILLSVDRNTSKIHMISFMRDLRADIPGYGVQKLNAACALGGCPLLVETLEENYKVGIDNYISIDYNGMIAMIDALGGVQLEVSDSEAELANGLIRDMADTRGESPDSHYFSGAGSYLCDGYQATAFSRVRFTGNSDYERTERQRKVMTQILSKVKSMGMKDLEQFALQVLPNLTHNIDAVSMLLLLPQIPTYATYEIEESRVPYDGLFHTENEILMPDMDETIRILQETVYG